MITGPEPIVALAVTKLTTNLNTFIDSVNAEQTDGVLVEYPQQILDYPPPRTSMTSYPIIAVVEGRFLLEDDTGSGGTGRLPLTIVSYITATDPGVLAKQLRRMDRAVTECIMEGRRLPPLGWGMRFLHSDPGPTLGREEAPREYMSLRATTIEVRFEQDTP